ncbi:dephospho-CoA kinase [Rhodoferax sp.]|uniref:dephospho-CoA kinase n=1 Tax=Rhodoferax sp. TaxID=50421 RepID=UPI0025CB8D34|nr:dephospho-CoA kinase [Rhodoferax sp.]
MRVGLTGGIGSGKSTVAALLAAKGAVVVDADAVSRACTAPGGAAIAFIRDTFGDDLIDAKGALDRQKMRELVFQDSTARKRLEAIIHPLVAHEMERDVAVQLAAGASCVVFDIPLLVESAHWRSRLDFILVVDCEAQTQIARVVRRSGLTESEVRGVMATQASRAKRLSAADHVLYNDGLTLDQLEVLTAQIYARFGL